MSTNAHAAEWRQDRYIGMSREELEQRLNDGQQEDEEAKRLWGFDDQGTERIEADLAELEWAIDRHILAAQNAALMAMVRDLEQREWDTDYACTGSEQFATKMRTQRRAAHPEAAALLDEEETE